MAKNDWILDVLADLKAFAKSNGLNAISEQLDDTMLVAAGELASDQEEARTQVHGETQPIGSDFGGPGCHNLA